MSKKRECLSRIYGFYDNRDGDEEYYTEDERLMMIFRIITETISEESKKLYEENALLSERVEKLTLALGRAAEDKERMADMIEAVKKQIANGEESD